MEKKVVYASNSAVFPQKSCVGGVIDVLINSFCVCGKMWLQSLCGAWNVCNFAFVRRNKAIPSVMNKIGWRKVRMTERKMFCSK